MTPNTHCHVFTVSGGDWPGALTFATRRYRERWGIDPFNLFIHPQTAVFTAPGLAVMRDERIPAGQLWPEVPSGLVVK